MSKRAYKNKRQQLENEALFVLWQRRLKSYYHTIFKWEGFDSVFGLPSKEIAWYLNEILYHGRTAGYTVRRITAGDGVLPSVVVAEVPLVGELSSSGAVTWYGGAAGYTFQTHTDSFLVPRDDVAVCYPSMSRYPVSELVDTVARNLMACEQCVSVNLRGQNTPVIITAPPGQELTYANIFEEVAGYKPVVYGREGLLSEQKDTLFGYRFLAPAQYVADKVEMLKHDIINDFFNALGVSAKSIEKKAQIIADELNIDALSNNLVKRSFMDARKDFCAQCAALGAVFDCVYNVDEHIETIMEGGTLYDRSGVV